MGVEGVVGAVFSLWLRGAGGEKVSGAERYGECRTYQEALCVLDGDAWTGGNV